MAQFNLGNLCGTNANFNKLEVQFEDLKKKLLDDIEAEASALVSNMTGGLVQLDLNLRNLLSEKPTLPNVNLQSEIKDLIGLATGSKSYNNKVVTLITQFGNALAGDNKDLVKLVAGAAALIAGGKDICDLIPNMIIPAAGGAVTTLAKNVSQPDENSIIQITSTIQTPVAALNKANENIAKRLSKAAEFFKREIVKIDATAGTTGRVSAKTRRIFLEADEKIRSSMSEEGYTLPVDMKLQDITDMETHLIGGTGTAKPWVNPDENGTAIKEQGYEKSVTAAVAPLSASISKLSESLKRASGTFPYNTNSDGTKVYFDNSSSEIQDIKHACDRAKQFQSRSISAIMSNKEGTDFDTSSILFKSFETDMKSLSTKLETSLASLDTNFTRPVTDIDKIIEEDIEITVQSLPKISDVI